MRLAKEQNSNVWKEAKKTEWQIAIEELIYSMINKEYTRTQMRKTFSKLDSSSDMEYQELRLLFPRIMTKIPKEVNKTEYIEHTIGAVVGAFRPQFFTKNNIVDYGTVYRDGSPNILGKFLLENCNTPISASRYTRKDSKITPSILCSSKPRKSRKSIKADLEDLELTAKFHVHTYAYLFNKKWFFSPINDDGSVEWIELTHNVIDSQKWY